ncbi:MAG: hypothetical protein WBJ81_00300 [Rickettsiales bacterium]
MARNINNYNFIIAENFDLASLVHLMVKEKDWECKIEFFVIRANEVISTKTKNAELIIVAGGSGGVIIKGESNLIKTGDIIYVPENSLRSVANINYNELLQIVLITVNK